VSGFCERDQIEAIGSRAAAHVGGEPSPVFLVLALGERSGPVTR
jgi:hypothetical protein